MTTPRQIIWIGLNLVWLGGAACFALVPGPQELSRLNHDIENSLSAASTPSQDLHDKLAARKKLLLALADDPSVFRQYAFPQNILDKVPASDQDLVEKPVQMTGGFMVRVADDQLHNRAGYVYQLMSLPEHHLYKLHFSKRPVGLKPGSVISVKGLKLDDDIVVDDVIKDKL